MAASLSSVCCISAVLSLARGLLCFTLANLLFGRLRGCVLSRVLSRVRQLLGLRLLVTAVLTPSNQLSTNSCRACD